MCAEEVQKIIKKAQEEGLALLQADLGRHIRELEAEAKDRMRLSLVVGSVAGVLLIIIFIYSLLL